MINRRQLTSGLLSGLGLKSLGLASLGLTLTGCGGVALSQGSDAKKGWKSPFANDYAKLDDHRTNNRTTPATVEELMQPGVLPERTLGDKNAKVTVIEYFSLTCPVCHAFHQKTWPAFRRKYINTGKIYFIAREFPIGHASGHASLALRCIDERRYFKLLNRFLAEQRLWVSQEVRLDAIAKVAAPVGLKRSKFNACLADKALVANINKAKQRGRELGVIGTPTFFINGKQLRGALTLQQISAEIDPLLA